MLIFTEFGAMPINQIRNGKPREDINKNEVKTSKEDRSNRQTVKLFKTGKERRQ